MATNTITNHRSNSNIKLIATLLSTTRATYLNSTTRLETTAIPLPLFPSICPLDTPVSCPSQMPAIRIEIADLDSKARVSFDHCEILDLFPVKRATIGDNAIHSAWYTAQRLSTIGIRRNLACYRARHGYPCLTYDGLYHLRMNSVFGWPLSPISRRGFIRLTDKRRGRYIRNEREREVCTTTLYGIFNLIICKWIWIGLNRRSNKSSSERIKVNQTVF